MRSGKRGAEEFAHFLAEGGLLGGEAEVHAGLLFVSVQCHPGSREAAIRDP